MTIFVCHQIHSKYFCGEISGFGVGVSFSFSDNHCLSRFLMRCKTYCSSLVTMWCKFYIIGVHYKCKRETGYLIRAIIVHPNSDCYRRPVSVWPRDLFKRRPYNIFVDVRDSLYESGVKKKKKIVNLLYCFL